MNIEKLSGPALLKKIKALEDKRDAVNTAMCASWPMGFLRSSEVMELAISGNVKNPSETECHGVKWTEEQRKLACADVDFLHRIEPLRSELGAREAWHGTAKPIRRAAF